MERTTPPPGTFLAAGGLIGTGLATLALVAPSLPARFADSPVADRLLAFDLGLDALGVLAAFAMLACAAGLIVKGASFVTWSLALVVVHGLAQLGGATIERMFLGGTSTLLTLRLLFVIATGLVGFAPLLIAYVVLERRRGAAPQPVRRGAALLVVEGVAACLFLGASLFATATYAHSLAAFHSAEADREGAAAPLSGEAIAEAAPAPAAPDDEPHRPHAVAGDDPGGRPGEDPGMDSGGAGGDAGDAAAGAAIFRRSLASARGGKRPLWKTGPRATIVDFWASWCGPCLYELPQLQALHEKLGERGLEIVLVNVDLDEPRPVGQFLARRGIGIDSLVDRDSATFQELGLRALPSMFLLDASGRPVQSYVGASPAERLERDVLRLLGGAGDARSRNG